MEMQGTCFLCLNRGVQHQSATSLEISEIHRGCQIRQRSQEAAKMQHLKWHQAPMFMMLDQAQHASTELAFPIKEKEDFKGK